VVVKPLRWLVRSRLYCLLERRLPRLNAASKTLAEHADRAEFHRYRDLVAAARAGALDLRFHRPTTLASPEASEAWISSAISAGSGIVWHTDFQAEHTDPLVQLGGIRIMPKRNIRSNTSG